MAGWQKCDCAGLSASACAHAEPETIGAANRLDFDTDKRRRPWAVIHSYNGMTRGDNGARLPVKAIIRHVITALNCESSGLQA